MLYRNAIAYILSYRAVIHHTRVARRIKIYLIFEVVKSTARRKTPEFLSRRKPPDVTQGVLFAVREEPQFVHRELSIRSRYEIAGGHLKNRGKYFTRNRYAATLSGLRDANGPLLRVIAYKSLFSAWILAVGRGERRVNDGYDVERIRRRTSNGNALGRKKKGQIKKKENARGRSSMRTNNVRLSGGKFPRLAATDHVWEDFSFFCAV